jgi:hypothetical protein
MSSITGKSILNIMDEYDPGWNTRPLPPGAMQSILNMYSPSANEMPMNKTSKKINKKKALFSRLRETFKKAAKEGTLKNIVKGAHITHEQALSKRAALLEAGKKVDFIKEGYEMFDDEFKGKDGYAEFIGTREYSLADSVKKSLEKTMAGQEIQPKDVYEHLSKKFGNFYEKVYMKKKGAAAASVPPKSASKPKKGGARKRTMKRKTVRKGRKVRKTHRKH